MLAKGFSGMHEPAATPEMFGFGRLYYVIREAVIVGDAERGTVALWNPAAESLFGYTSGEMVGKPISVLVPPNLRPRHEAGLARVAATGHGPLVDGGGAVELPAVRRDGVQITIELTLAPLTDIPGSGRFVLALIRDVSLRVRRRERLEAALRAARLLATAPDGRQALRQLLAEAAEGVGAEYGMVCRWDEANQRLECVAGSTPGGVELPSNRLGEGMSGRAAQARKPILENSFGRDFPERTLARAGIQAGIAVPLLHEGQLLGTLAVSTTQLDKRFDEEDVETLEVLAGLAAAALAGLEGARLAGVLLAARTAEHELNNRLASVSGQVQLMLRDSRLPESLRERAASASREALAAAETVRRLLTLTALEEKTWGERMRTIDLDRSPGGNAVGPAE